MSKTLRDMQYKIDEIKNENERLKKISILYYEELSKNEKAKEYIKSNCILSDEWTDLGFCNFTPTGRISYKKLSKTKIKELLDILEGKDESN